MIFISLVKLKEKPSKETIAKGDKITKQLSKEGVKIIGRYWTLGRYDAVLIFEAPDEKASMKVGIAIADTAKTETLVAIPREEAAKLLE
jgi:uncharacterized protein with GYD domain